LSWEVAGAVKVVLDLTGLATVLTGAARPEEMEVTLHQPAGQREARRQPAAVA
jgi:hypothetical protein